jgi:transcriptional regulator with XRE-family HTH domain
MSEDVAAHLGANVRELRERRGMTQAQISKVANVPRATVANVESGSSNPTLSVLVRLATALQVSLDELTAPPRATAKLYRAEDLPTRKKGQVVVRKLLPDPIPGLEIERMEFAPGAVMSGVPHTSGTREYLTCEVGELELAASGERWRLGPGDVVVFRGDQNHGYRNVARRRSIAYSVVALAPAAG